MGYWRMRNVFIINDALETEECSGAERKVRPPRYHAPAIETVVSRGDTNAGPGLSPKDVSLQPVAPKGTEWADGGVCIPYECAGYTVLAATLHVGIHIRFINMSADHPRVQR